MPYAQVTRVNDAADGITADLMTAPEQLMS